MRCDAHAYPMARLATATLLLCMAAATTRAEPDVGAPPGNALNPAPINPATMGRWMDEEGLGTRIPAARTPTGRLYNMPLDPGEDSAPAKGAWETTGLLELGVLRSSGDERAQGFRNYKDLRDGPYVNNFGFSGEKRDEARFAEAVGGAFGLRDAFYRFQYGRYNDWKVSGFYDETPKVFTTTYRSLWDGVGSNDLTLAALKPGGTTNAATTQANIQNALAATPPAELEVVRRKAGVRFDKTLGESWKLYASFANDNRQGAQPFGAVFGGGGGGGNIEIAQSIDYATYDVVGGVQYNDARSSFNLRASASFFRNAMDTMTFQNPLFVTLNGTTGLSPTTFTQGRFDLAPNNEHYNVKGEYARALPDLYRGNLTAALAVGSMRQNDRLVAPTELSLTGGTVTAGGASLANVWNTTDALSRQDARARIDTVLADLGLALKPASALDVRAKLRYYETRNSMDYMACNPLTGQWGRILNDGSGLSLVTANTIPGANPAGTSANAFNAARCDLAAAMALNLAPSTGNIPIASAPYDYKQLNATVSADYRLGRSSSVNALLERETFHRDFRERDETWEDKVKLTYVDRGSIEGTIRVSYEYARRGGGDYNSNPYLPFLSASLGPTPAANSAAMASWFHTIEQFRSFDLADRNQNIVNGRVNYTFHQNVDAAMTVQLKDAEYPALYGRTGHQRSNSVTLDLSYQAGSTAMLYAFSSWQGGSMAQRGVQPNSCTLGSTYYFFSDGSVASAVSTAAPPPAPAGATLVATQPVVASNWNAVCAAASPTSPLFPESRTWDVSSKDRSGVIGGGLKYDFGKAKLDTNVSRTFGRTRIRYAYNAAALGTPLVPALAGDGPSDLVFAQNVLSASLVVPLAKDLSVRFLYRYESGKVRDWHYDAVVANPLPANNAAYLDGGPLDYRATLVGILLQLRI